MIRYAKASVEAIEPLVDAQVKGWRAAALARTATFKKQKKFTKGTPSWSAIKFVYMELQHNKCAFCERPLGGKIEQDVEHFRPKSSVKLWPPTTKKKKGSPPFSYPFSTGGNGAGYYWLAYELGNYAASCKDCNTIRKSNYFPVAGKKRGTKHLSVEALNAMERPLLIYPLGKGDADPESLISFEGILAMPVHANGEKHRRALVSIDFFGLNKREELWADRFRTIESLLFKYKAFQTSKVKAERDAAKRGIDDAVSDAGPQSGCARAFLRLLENDPEKAWQIFLDAEAYRKGRTPPERVAANSRSVGN